MRDYDPTEPLIVAYSDVIAARNAIAQLVTIVKHDSYDELERSYLCNAVRTAVLPNGEKYEFDDVAEVLEWLTELRDRMTHYLPTPPSGVVVP